MKIPIQIITAKTPKLTRKKGIDTFIQQTHNTVKDIICKENYAIYAEIHVPQDNVSKGG